MKLKAASLDRNSITSRMLVLSSLSPDGTWLVLEGVGEESEVVMLEDFR